MHQESQQGASREAAARARNALAGEGFEVESNSSMW